MVGKIPDQHLNVWLYSNPGDKVQKRWRTMGQICPILLTRIWTLSPRLENNHTLKCWSSTFPTILTYMMILEKCQNNISVYGYSPIQGTKFYSCWNLMKPGSQNGTYAKMLSAFNFFFLGRLIRGWDLIMWTEGQWEASKKIAWEGDIRQTNKHTDMSTLWPTRPRGPSWWKWGSRYNSRIGVNFD